MRFQCSVLLISYVGLMGMYRVSAASPYECTAWSIQECLIASTLDQFGVYHLDDDVPTWTDSVNRLRLRCQRYNDFSTCVEPLIPSCNSSMQLALEGLDNAYQYLCTSEGMSDYSSNQSCYIRSDVRAMADSCNHTYAFRLSTISYSRNAVALYCGYVDDYIECLKTGIASLCGEKAAKWQSDWIRNLRKPAMIINKCPGWVVADDSSSAWASALLVSLALTTALMIVGILTLVIVIRRRMLRERRRRSLNDPGAGGLDGDPVTRPPPYSIVVETPGPDGQMQPHLVDSLSPASQEEASSGNLQGASSAPFKVPILPPPYYERTEECAPPYYEALAGLANEGLMGEEADKYADDTRQLVAEN